MCLIKISFEKFYYLRGGELFLYFFERMFNSIGISAKKTEFDFVNVQTSSL